MKPIVTLIVSSAILGYISCSPNEEVNQKQRILSRVKRQTSDQSVPNLMTEDCDQSGIPAMESFDMHRFSGDWYELGKTLSGHTDADDGMWRITANELFEASFLYSGRKSNSNCMRPLAGKIKASATNAGELTLKYKTYTSNVKETVRILHTDYDTLAVIYMCLYKDDHTGGCHKSGVFASVWTRAQHVDVNIYEKAIDFLSKACIDSHSFRVRNVRGPCNVDENVTPEESDRVSYICLQPLDNGTCSGNVQRLYYDSKDKQCIEFNYTGCGGNQNNFLSHQECENRCLGTGLPEPEKCARFSPCSMHCPPCCSEKDNGCVECECGNVIIDQFLNCLNPLECSPSCKAVEKYPGCYICECQESESEDATAICLEPKQPGSCHKKIQRFFYNAVTRECENFNFTGCGGNNNNFITHAECSNSCKAENRNYLKTIELPSIPDAANTPKLHLFGTFSMFMAIFIMLIH